MVAAFSLLALHIVCADDEIMLDPIDSSDRPKRNLTEQEIRDLPVGVTFDKIKDRLRYYTGAAIAVPIISFEIHDGNGKRCTMAFAGADDILKFAVVEPEDASRSNDAIVIWPKEYAGQPISRLLEAIQDKEKKKGEPGATDNPDDAQRSREDH
jgi:hypothetical protein